MLVSLLSSIYRAPGFSPGSMDIQFKHILTTSEQDDLGVQRLEELPLQDDGYRYTNRSTRAPLRPTLHNAWQGKSSLFLVTVRDLVQ